MADRAEFLANVRRLVGRDAGSPPVVPPPATGLSVTREGAMSEAEQARSIAEERSAELYEEAAQEAEIAGWKVHRLSSASEIANRVLRICRERNIETALTSSHEVLERNGISETLNNAGISAEVLRAGSDGTKGAAFSAGVGITGADWFIAESGTLVLHPRSGLSRLVSLAPPIHIAVLEPGHVLPSLNELFAIERASMLDGTLTSSVNLISGPSRTGDIEATIVTGIHGPVETHLLMANRF